MENLLTNINGLLNRHENIAHLVKLDNGIKVSPYCKATGFLAITGELKWCTCEECLNQAIGLNIISILDHTIALATLEEKDHASKRIIDLIKSLC